MNKLIAVALAACLLVVIGAFCQSSSFQNPTITSTTNQDRDWHINFLKTRISSLHQTSEGVQITGRVFQSHDAETRIASVGYKITFPDDHGSKVYRIADIQPEGVVIEYEASFDHRSFGNNLIERDSGSFTLAWSEPEAGPGDATSDNRK